MEKSIPVTLFGKDITSFRTMTVKRNGNFNSVDISINGASSNYPSFWYRLDKKEVTELRKFLEEVEKQIGKGE